MIPADVDVFVALEPVNLSLSFDRLAGLVEERMGRSARSAALFVFFNRRRTMVKALFFDGTGPRRPAPMRSRHPADQRWCGMPSRQEFGPAVVPAHKTNVFAVELDLDGY